MILHLLNSFLTFNLLVVILYLFVKFVPRVSSPQRLKLIYGGILLSLMMAILQPLMPKHQYLMPSLKVWSAGVKYAQQANSSYQTESSYITLSSKVSAARVNTSTLFIFCGVLLLGLLIWSLSRIGYELYLLKDLQKSSLLLRRYKRVRIYLSDRIQIPFSYYYPGALISVIPSSLVVKPDFFRAAFYHEFQHHRQGDTFWAYPLLFIKNLCFINPMVHLLITLIQETQEYACDEALISQHKVEPQSYIGCLMEVAQNSVQTHSEPVCATGLCFSRQKRILKRRIEIMKDLNSIPGRSGQMKVFALLLGLMIVVSSWGARNLVQDKKLTMEEAQLLIKDQGAFPLIVNEAVLAELNRYLGTPEGRSFMKESLERKSQFNEILEAKTKTYGTPTELNAVPIVESGYQNIKTKKHINAVGIWMFIPATARNYGMKVNKKADERLNVEMETDAAHRYLMSNHARFKDWHLSLLAFNIGEGTLQKGIDKFKTRDAWELISKGVEGDKNYLPRVMAAVLIMKNPDLLKD